jgi:hypothetical protein
VNPKRCAPGDGVAERGGDEQLRRGVAGSEDVRQCQRGELCRCALAAVRQLLPGACGTWQNIPLSLFEYSDDALLR